MAYLSDIEIAQRCKPEHIGVIAKRAHVDEKYIEQYGNYKAKIDLSLLSETKRENGKLILVTAITPTPAGEGKTTTTIGLADGLRRIGKDVTVALREPSLGPVFGVKGGAAGGGYAQVVPMEDINLHFTGDFHAIGAANNLLAAMLDNHIQQGNALGIDVRKITWKRCVDMNDRQLRFIVDGMGGKANGMPREDGFDITVASEIMAVLCLSSSITDLKARLSRMIVGYTYDDKPVTCGELKAAGRKPDGTSAAFPDYDGLIERAGLSRFVRWIGYVDEADKPLLYRSAEVFAFPSRHEGFGLPPLEAMACGTPVVVGDSGSLPEVIGPAGFAIDPDDVRGMAGAIIALVMDEQQAADLRRAGPQQAAQFTWERTAKETLDVYRRVTGDE